MAELLVVTEDHAGYTRGDILAIAPDGHTWGLEEDPDVWVAAGRDPDVFPNPFVIVELPRYPPDADLAEVLEIETDDGFDVDERRAWGVDLDATTARGRKLRATTADIRSKDGAALPLSASRDQTPDRGQVGAKRPPRPKRG